MIIQSQPNMSDSIELVEFQVGTTTHQYIQSNTTIEFGSLVGFAKSGEGVPTLQADQLNVIAHHLNQINTNVDLWPNKSDWPQLLNSLEILPTQLKVNKLRRKLLIDMLEGDNFLKSEWKQLNRYKDAGMFGDPVQADNWMTVLPWVWTYL